MNYKINLLTRKGESAYDRILYFSLHYLRYILVITQLMVIAVFFIKFSVDQQIVDLKESIDQKTEIISVSQPLLSEAKSAHNKIDFVKGVIDKQTNFTSAFDYLTSVFPDKFFLTNLSYEQGSILMQGVSLDASVVQSFLARLKEDKKFKVIELTSLRKSEKGFEFIFHLATFQS